MIEIDPEDTNEPNSTVDPTHATASFPNEPALLAITNTPSAECGGAMPVPETPSLSLLVSFDVAQDLLSLGNAPENQSDSSNSPTLDGKPTAIQGTDTSTPALAGGSVKGKRSKDDHKKRTNPNSTTPEYVFCSFLYIKF